MDGSGRLAKGISLVMIVKNEETNLPLCLARARSLVDEMVVVDTGSTDRTVELALAAGARVEHFKWVDDFAAARNFSAAQRSQVAEVLAKIGVG